MRENCLTIDLPCTPAEAFEFTANPRNTSRWIDFIVTEAAGNIPPKLGTVYINLNDDGKFARYRITSFEQDSMFIMDDPDSDYHVCYSFRPLEDGSCEFEYREWVDRGELANPFPHSALIKLREEIITPEPLGMVLS